LYRRKRWARKVARYVQKDFSSEIIFCPNGDVFERDDQGAEFLVPTQLGGLFKFGNIKHTEATETTVLLRHLRPGDILFDIGANAGIHSIRLARAVPGLQVYAFEPVNLNHQVLSKNVARNGLEDSIHVLRLAVGEASGTAQMISGFGTGNFLAEDQSVRQRELESVEVVSIDSFVKENGIRSVSAIKCDVEGYEHKVLSGAQKCLTIMRPIVLVELFASWAARYGYHPVDTFHMLQDLGYTWISISRGVVLPSSGNPHVDLQVAQNFCFLPSELSEE
jgi:FkbM family methyltransferase